MSPDRAILHVDMDAFFASVELLRHPELMGQPVVVGGSGERGVVAAASYEARSYGIHSAMPSVRARRLCPHAVFIPGDHAHYSEVSARIMAIFQQWTPLVEPLSLDEAFLDVGGATRLFGPPAEIGRLIRSQVLDETGLHSSIGAARNKFLAKLATSRAKPSASRGGPVRGPGVFELAPGAEQDFLDSLEIAAIWGVGPATLARLRPLGISTVAELRTIPLALLVGALGEGPATRLRQLAVGIDDRPVQPRAEPKSISHEETFMADVADREELRVHLVRQVDGVASRLRSNGLHARTVNLKLRYADFRTLTRSRSMDTETDSTRVILRVASELLDALQVNDGVRLLGVGVSSLRSGVVARQMSFDDLVTDGSDGGSDPGPEPGSWRAADDAVDRIRERFGLDSIGPASLSGRHRGVGDHQWGPGSAAVDP